MEYILDHIDSEFHGGRPKLTFVFKEIPGPPYPTPPVEEIHHADGLFRVYCEFGVTDPARTVADRLRETARTLDEETLNRQD
jgi:hypothetical protein